MNGKIKAVFLDRDGTINVDYGYVYQKDKLKFISGVLEGLKKLQDAGFKLFIVTNQSGIARGYYSVEQMNEFHEYMTEKLKVEGIVIEKIYYCPHLSGCDCRKPKLKLFYQAVEEYNIDLSKSYAIGDRIRDLALCNVEPVGGYLIGNEERVLVKSPIVVCDNLLQAAEDIVRKEHDK